MPTARSEHIDDWHLDIVQTAAGWEAIVYPSGLPSMRFVARPPSGRAFRQRLDQAGQPITNYSSTLSNVANITLLRNQMVTDLLAVHPTAPLWLQDRMKADL